MTRYDGDERIPGIKFRRRLFALMFLAIFVRVPAYAVNPDFRISQYAHTTWRLQDGFFSDLPASIAQTKDGYLWMGTRSGLLRFDGVRSVPFTSLGGKPLPSGRIEALLGAHDGSLWIGSAAGLVQWKGGELNPYPAINGGIVQILEDADGVIWVARNGQHDHVGPLCKISNETTKCFGAADGIPADMCCPESLSLDTNGGVWLGGGYTLLELRANIITTHRLALRTSYGAGMLGLAGAPDGSMWVGMAVRGRRMGLQRFVRGAWKPFVTGQLDGSTLEVTSLIMDHNGSLWVGTVDKGIYRIHGGKVDHFTNADGLTSDFVSWMFEDGEGNIWVRTPKGIDSFRDLRVITWSSHEGLTADNVSSVVATHDGTVWAGNANGLDFIHAGSVVSIRSGKGLPGNRPTALFEDRGGRLWVGVEDDLTVFEHGRFKKIRGKPGKPLGPITGITQDNGGDIWAEAYGEDQRLLRIHADKLVEELRTPETRVARPITADAAGNIWMGLESGDLAVYRHGSVETIAYEHEPRSRVRAVVAGNDGSVFGATNYGVVGWRNGLKRTLSTQNGLPCLAAYAVVFDKAGNLWISTQCGAFEVDKAELQKWWDSPGVEVRLKTLDILDGLQPGPAHFDAAASRSPDGRLWFATGTLLQMIDPAALGASPIVPPVRVEEVRADHRSLPAQDGVRLPALTHDLEIDYTALSFISPLKVRFRYKMEGHEVEWQDAGTRRQAFYNDLGPGTYRFHVIACNHDGIWNNTGATLVFVIPAAFYQTWWFRLLCGLVGAGALWMFYRYRLKEATAKIQERLDGRLEERERIARELHDTLLQGFHGLVLRFQAVMNVLPEHAPAHQMMEKVLDRADEVLLEGRQRVRELRSEGSAENDLSNILTNCGKELSQDREARFSLTVVGTPRTLEQTICDDAYRIGREALVNAFQHSAAAKIEVEITYDTPGMQMVIRDDGQGLDQAILDKGRDGHWGLAGMRERAQKIGAKLNIWSKPGAGTEIELRIPAAIAYPRVRDELHRFRRSGSSRKKEV